MNWKNHNLRWLLKHYRPYKKFVVKLVVFTVLHAGVAAAMPYFFIFIIDGIKGEIDPSFIRLSVLGYLGLGLLTFLLSVYTAWLRVSMNLRLEWDFRQQTFNHILNLSRDFFHRFKTGDVVTRLTDDVGRKLSWFSCSALFRSLDSLLRIIFCLVIMFSINPVLTLVVLIPLPVQFIIFVKSTGILHRRFRALQDIISKVTDAMATCFSGIRVVQAYTMEKRQARKFREIAEERADAEIRAAKVHALVHSFYGYFWQTAIIMVLLVGGWFIINDRLTIGEFVAFDYYVVMLVFPMMDIGHVLVNYRRASVSIKRIREIEDHVPQVAESEKAADVPIEKGSVEFINVGLEVNDQRILHDVSFKAEPGKMTALVGTVGSGKSTLLSLIVRLLDPTQGEIKIDGRPIKELSLRALRAAVGFVPQEALLFTDTIKNNILFGRKNLTEEQMLWAADIAQLTGEINKFPHQYETKIGLRGMTVSGGQKQRIALARAIVAKPKILILDDVTAALDADTETKLWEKLYDVLPGITTFVVSHRTATLERADEILVFYRGHIVERGLHHELMDARGLYYKIYSKRKLEDSGVTPLLTALSDMIDY